MLSTGATPRDDDHWHRVVAELALLHGLATAIWGDRHDHARFSRHGRAVLARVLGNGSRLA